MDLIQTARGPIEAQVTPPAEEFREQLKELAVKWRSQREKDLELRYQTGKLLNGHFGTPDTRQSRGKETLKCAAEELNISVTDLSRMRNFAFRFKSFTEFKRQHPLVMTWNAVKSLLPKPKPTGNAPTGDGGKAKKRNGVAGLPQAKEATTSKSEDVEAARPQATEATTSTFEDVEQYLASLTSSLQQGQLVLSEDEKGRLEAMLWDLLSEVEGFQETQECVEDEPTEATSSGKRGDVFPRLAQAQ